MLHISFWGIYCQGSGKKLITNIGENNGKYQQLGPENLEKLGKISKQKLEISGKIGDICNIYLDISHIKKSM
jgi:hypothetical protein